MRLSLREILRTRSQRCPRCGEKWLVSGAEEGDQHICKSCGEHFFIRLRGPKARGEHKGSTPLNPGVSEVGEAVG